MRINFMMFDFGKGIELIDMCRIIDFDDESRTWITKGIIRNKKRVYINRYCQARSREDCKELIEALKKDADSKKQNEWLKDQLSQCNEVE